MRIRIQRQAEGIHCREVSPVSLSLCLSLSVSDPNLSVLAHRRNPLSRALSVYYFWGELWRMKNVENKQPLRPQKDRKGKPRHRALSLSLRDAQQGVPRPPPAEISLGRRDGKNATVIRGPLFTYHGSELTVPPEEIAMAYATQLPYRAGMPGPSFAWSCYANTVGDAIKGFGVQKRSAPARTIPRISPFVTERMDESLIVLSRHLAWSVADLVNVVPRKVRRRYPAGF
jgi:hypothetical protein